jgi:hypothetical protein
MPQGSSKIQHTTLMTTLLVSAAGFLNNVMELGDGPGEWSTIFVQGVQQSGDGSVCPPKNHPDWPCSAVRVSQVFPVHYI